MIQVRSVKSRQD